jgi:hypothetical protein
MREYTQQELQAVMEAEQQLRVRGLIVDDSDGKDAVAQNSERISAFFELNKNVPLTVQTILAACEQMREQMRWKSSAQVEYETLYNQLSQAQKDQFGAWWFSPSTKKTILIEGEEGFNNAVKILQWMRGRTFDSQTFNLAVTNLASTHGLHWAPTPRRTDPRQHQQDGKGFMSKDSVNLTARDHAAKRAAQSAVAAGDKPAAPATDYRALAESTTTGRTHSDSLRLQKLFVMQKNNPTEIDWEQTAHQRQRLADGKAR